MNTVLTITRKDLSVELRKQGVINSVLLFSVLVLLVVYFSIDHDRRSLNQFGPPAFWISLLFASSLGLNHFMRMEKENNCLAALITSPVPPWKVYLAKMLSVLALLGLVELLLVPAFFVLFGFGVTGELLPFLLVLLLGNIGIASLGTLFSSLLIVGRASEFLLPLLMIPLLLPLLIAGVQASSPLLLAAAESFTLPGTPLNHASTWIIFLLAMDLIFVPAGGLLAGAVFRL